MRILLVISTKGWGGTEAYVSLLSQGLSLQGNKVWVACSKNSVIAHTLKNLPILYLSTSPIFYLSSLLKMVIFILYHRIQIIHGNSGKEYWLVMIAGLLTFRKVVLSRHLMTPFSSHTRALVLFKVSKVVAPAKVTYEVLVRSGIPARNLELLYNGIDPAPFRVPHGKYRALYHLPEKAFVTGIISNIHYPRGKGHFTLIDSIPRILGKIPNGYWMIGGNGPLMPELIRYAQRLRVDNRILWTGHLTSEQVPHILSCLDLFVLFSYDQEGGCPLSIMEAMASGLPVIASTIGGNAEIVENKTTGYLLAPDDLNGLIEHSVYLYEHPDQRKKMGDEGRKKINSYFNFGRMAEETAVLYRRLLS